jgi:hypothetical protein
MARAMRAFLFVAGYFFTGSAWSQPLTQPPAISTDRPACFERVSGAQSESNR